MTDKIVSSTIEILGKLYPIRCAESELVSLQQAAEFLDKKMAEVRDSGKVINLERIAIITALNIAHEFLNTQQQKSSYMSKINQYIENLQTKLETSISQAKQTEFVYSDE